MTKIDTTPIEEMHRHLCAEVQRLEGENKHLREWVSHLSEEANQLERLREAYRLPRLTNDVCMELRIAYVDHDDNRDETLAAVIEWYLRARALTAGGKSDLG